MTAIHETSCTAARDARNVPVRSVEGMPEVALAILKESGAASSTTSPGQPLAAGDSACFSTAMHRAAPGTRAPADKPSAPMRSRLRPDGQSRFAQAAKVEAVAGTFDDSVVLAARHGARGSAPVHVED